MRKSFLLILVLFLTLVCACAAAASEYALEAISGSISFDEKDYVVLTPDNLADHPDLLAEIGATAEDLKADLSARNVLLQAWTKDKKTCVEVSVFQDEASAKYYDLKKQDSAARKQYRQEQINSFKSQGYTTGDSEMKQHPSGYYFVTKYSVKSGNKIRRGYARTTVRNGYTLFVDYVVYDRIPTKTDKDRGRKIINTIKIEEVAPVAASASSSQSAGSASAQSGSTAPSGAAGTLQVTVMPPEGTNDGVFTVEGKAYPNSKLTIVAMRWSGSGKALHFIANATKRGNFSAKVTLPEEGLYQFTINMEIDNVLVADQVLNTVTFSKSLLPIRFDAPIPEEVSASELVVSGVTDKSVNIQCIVTNRSTGSEKALKAVKTNRTGKFKFNVPLEAEGEYEIYLSFQKKNLNSEQKKFTVTKVTSTKEVQAKTGSKAIHPAYNLLTRKIDSYVGDTMIYTVYITDIQQDDEEWIVTAALKQNKKGEHSNYLVYIAKEDPGLTVGSKVKIYGVCSGRYPLQSEEGNSFYPRFDYLFVE